MVSIEIIFNMNEHEELLSEWAKNTGQTADFIKDGVIDPDRYQQTKTKVMFLLKEAYQSGESPNGFDLRLVIREKWKGPRGKTWHTVGRWSYAAQGGTVFPAPSDAAKEALLSSAVVNIKKSNGRSRSDMNEIRKIAQQDGELLKRQIALIAPDIVICGNTWGEVKHLWAESKRIFPRIWRTESITFINYWHPANQYPNDLNDLALSALLAKANAHQT
jgi:hypothetical protein